MNKIVVTGGSGFIGHNLIKSLVSDGYELLNIDTQKPPEFISDKVLWKPINILEQDKLSKAIVDYDPQIIIHLAARTDLDGKQLVDYDSNISGTQNIIDIAKKIKNLKKVIFTSSMYVCKPGEIPSDYKTYTPHTVYGESKVKGELLVREIKNSHFEWVIIRPTSIWGPWFNIPYIDFFKTVYEGRYFDFGKACTKTYGYVGNTVYQIKKIIDTPNISGSTYYLGDLPATNISEWASEISILMNKGKIKTVPFFMLKAAAYVGDVFKLIKLKFPITSFRLSNMMTDNVLPIKDIYEIADSPPYSRTDGIEETLVWLEKQKGYRYK